MVALAVFYRKNSGVNVTELEKQRRDGRLTGKKAVLTAFNRKISGVNGDEPEKQRS